MKALILFVGWCILFVLCWPIALLALILFPDRLAFVFTAAPRGHHGVGGVRIASRSTCFCPPVCWDGRGMSVMQSPPAVPKRSQY